MTVPRALVAAVLIVAMGGGGSRLVHIGLAHNQRETFARQDLACTRWNEAARDASYDADPRRAPDLWLALYKAQGSYEREGTTFTRPFYC